MITLKGNGAYYEGTSSDQKPTDVPVNTEFRELDTNCRYYFTGESWAEIPSSGGGGGGGSDNYNELSNKPSINNVTLSGDKSLDNLGIQAKITGDVTISSDNVDDTGATNLFVTAEEKSAWNAKQDALTIDSSPTSGSENPVQSGGVYTALSGKQDTLSFNGTYNASTNKAATESTVTTAIGNLDKSSVGLDNVTNNAQIKALSGSVTSGGVVTFGADGATVQDSGKTIETSLSDSNDKIPTSKAVRDNVAANATMASGYTADSAEASITSSTSINDAIEQLDYRTTSNKNNILLKADKISFGFSGNPNPTVYEKDWDFVPDGIYLLAYICSQDASTRRGVSVYMFTKYTTNHIVLFTPVAEASGAIITSCVASGSAGAETITFTLAQRGYHTATAIQVVAF